MLNFIIHLLLNKLKKMKRKALLLILAVAMVSCGGDRPKNVEVSDKESETPDKFVMEIDGIYEKNDSIIVYYELDGSVKYENPTTLKITGSPEIQHLTVNLPENVPVESLIFTASTNKEQTSLMINNITVKNGKDIIDGKDYKFSENFLSDPSFKWDEKNARYTLIHTNQYPPSFVGSEKLKALLAK